MTSPTIQKSFSSFFTALFYKKDWMEQLLVCTRQNLKLDYFYRRHLHETTIRTTAMDLRSEDYLSKTKKPFVENTCYYPSHRFFIDTFTN